MKITYDRKADILYIKLTNAKITNTRMLSEDAYADIGENQNIVGIEIWKASKNAIQPILKDIAEEVKATLQKCA
jgi:uncharacterized protein YuzE